MKIVQLQLSQGKQVTATYPSATNDLHVSTAPCLRENVIFRFLTQMLLLRTLSRSRSLHPNHSRDHCRLHVHTPKHSLSLRVRRLNPTCQPNTEQFQGKESHSHLSTQHAMETQSHLTTQHRVPRQESARASERRQPCEMNGLQCSRLKVDTATKVVMAGERPAPGASSHHHIIASSARCRRTFGPAPCLKSIGAQGFGGCLPYAKRRYTKHSA